MRETVARNHTHPHSLHDVHKHHDVHESDSHQQPHYKPPSIYFMLLCTSTTLRDLRCMRGTVIRNHTTKRLHSLHDSLHRHHEERFEVHATQQAVFSLRHLQEDPKQLPLPFQLFQRS